MGCEGVRFSGGKCGGWNIEVVEGLVVNKKRIERMRMRLTMMMMMNRGRRRRRIITTGRGRKGRETSITAAALPPLLPPLSITTSIT